MPPASQDWPVRTRQSSVPAELISSMPTDQGPCFSCLIIQNMISIFIDLRMTPDDNGKMMACIAKTPY